VEVADHLVQAGGVEIGVDLDGLDAGMAEQLLQHPQVGAIGMQVGGKRVPQHMRRYPLGPRQPCGHGSFRDLQQGRLAGQRLGAIPQLGLKSSHSCATSVVTLR
jgi:hypothetical protein